MHGRWVEVGSPSEFPVWFCLLTANRGFHCHWSGSAKLRPVGHQHLPTVPFDSGVDAVSIYPPSCKRCVGRRDKEEHVLLLLFIGQTTRIRKRMGDGFRWVLVIVIIVVQLTDTEPKMIWMLLNFSRCEGTNLTKGYGFRQTFAKQGANPVDGRCSYLQRNGSGSTTRKSCSLIRRARPIPSF